MKKINIIITKEFGIELLDIFPLFSESKIITQKRIDKYLLDNTSIHYFEYLIIKTYNPTLFDDYKIDIERYNNHIYYKINIENFLKLAIKYKDFYNIKDESKDKNPKVIIDKYIKYSKSSKIINKDLLKYLEILFFTNL